MGRPYLVRTLYGRIAVIVTIALNIVISVLFVFFYWIGPRIEAEAQQRVRGTVAVELAREIAPIISQPTIDFAALERTLFRHVRFNPGDEIYLLDIDGKILGAFGFERTFMTHEFEIGPVRAFIEDPTRKNWPYFLSSTGFFDAQIAFSAALVMIDDHPGYLVVTLGSSSERRISKMLKESIGGRAMVIAAILVSLVATLCSLLVLRGVFGRFRTLVNGVRSLGGEIRPLHFGMRRGDELDEIAKALNEMSAEIASHVDKLESRDSLRRELIANVWHDLKAPVAALHGHLELRRTSSNQESDDAKALVEAFEAGLTYLGRMLNELHDLSRLEAKEVSPAFERTFASELVEDVLLTFKARANAAGVSLMVQGPAGHERTVRADPTMIARVLNNLVDNAIRHSSPGSSVTVAISELPERVEIAVCDSGEGIPESDLPHLFDRHFQGSDGGHGLRGALGLGLAIVKRILELHESAIEVSSRESRGTIFRFALPYWVDADQSAVQGADGTAVPRVSHQLLSLVVCAVAPLIAPQFADSQTGSATHTLHHPVELVLPEHSPVMFTASEVADLPFGNAVNLIAADLDGEKTDELVVTSESQIGIGKLVDGRIIWRFAPISRAAARGDLDEQDANWKTAAAADLDSDSKHELYVVAKKRFALYRYDLLADGSLRCVSRIDLPNTEPGALGLIASDGPEAQQRFISVPFKAKYDELNSFVLRSSGAIDKIKLPQYGPDGDRTVGFGEGNGDNIRDIYFTRHSKPGVYTFLSNSKDGNAVIRSDLPLELTLQDGMLGRFDGDLQTDSFVRASDIHGGWVCLAESNGGRCGPINIPLGNTSRWPLITSGDFDGDGDSDLAGVGRGKSIVIEVQASLKQPPGQQEGPGVCIGYNYSNTADHRWGRNILHCPPRTVVIEVDDTREAPGLTCCSVPSKTMLTGERSYHEGTCPVGTIAVGVWKEGTPHGVPMMTCERLNEDEYRVGKVLPGAYWGNGFSIRSGRADFDRNQIPLALRYGAGRVDRNRWDGDGCIGQIPGMVMVGYHGSHCNEVQFAQIMRKARPGMTNEEPAKLFKECKSVPDPFSPPGSCD